jgi:hypothetical protein
MPDGMAERKTFTVSEIARSPGFRAVTPVSFVRLHDYVKSLSRDELSGF